MVLGFTRRPATDNLGFRVWLADINYTRFGLLSKVAGLFDPLGAAVPITVKAKIRLGHLGVKGPQWEDAVTGTDREWWENYFEAMEQLKTVEFARCLFPGAKSSGLSWIRSWTHLRRPARHMFHPQCL